MLAQVIVGLDSQMYQVTLHTGHNNDPGAWNISGVCSYVELRNVKLLADGGTSLFKLYTLTHVRIQSLLPYYSGFGTVMSMEQ
jgi:hypothetical protein